MDVVRLRMEELARNTQREVLSLHPGGPPSLDSLRASLPLDLSALRRGVQLRAMYEHTVVTDAATLDYLGQVTAEGAQIRTMKQVPTRLTVLDRGTGLLPACEDALGGSALVIRGTGIVTALIALFERCWDSAPDWLVDQPGRAEGSTHRSAPLDERDQHLLRMLRLGVKDEAVARHLGVSVRTVRRQIAGLLDQLDASSRFQAGVHAASRGWLD